MKVRYETPVREIKERLAEALGMHPGCIRLREFTGGRVLKARGTTRNPLPLLTFASRACAKGRKSHHDKDKQVQTVITLALPPAPARGL